MKITRKNFTKIAVMSSAILVVLFILLPVFYLFIKLFDSDVSLTDAIFTSYNTEVFLNSIIMGSIVAIMAALIGIPLAWISVRWQFSFKKLFTILIILPLAIPSYISASSYKEVFSSYGLFPTLFNFTKMPFEMDGLLGCCIAMSFVNFPFIILLTRAALLKIDQNQEDVARTLGKSNRQIFFSIILPKLLPSITSGMLLVFLYAISDYGTPAIMNYSTFTLAIFQNFSMGTSHVAIILSLILIITACIILAMEHAFRTKGKLYNTGIGIPKITIPKKTKNCKLAFALSFLVIFLSVGIPVITLIYWMILGTSSFEALQETKEAAISSFLLAFIAALTTSFLAIPLVIQNKYKSIFSVVAHKLSYLGNAVPGVIIGFCLVRFASSYHWIYQTLPLLILGYSLRSLPKASASLATGVQQINPNTTEVAQTLGSSSFRIFQKVTLPQMRPAIISSFCIVFIFTIKELAITLILMPPFYSTLPKNIWDFAGEAAFSKLATPSLLILLISSVSIYLILKKESNDVRKYNKS